MPAPHPLPQVGLVGYKCGVGDQDPPHSTRPGCGGSRGLSQLEEQDLAGEGVLLVLGRGSGSLWGCRSGAAHGSALWVLVRAGVPSVCVWGLQEGLCLSHGVVPHVPQRLSAHPGVTGAALVRDGGPAALWEWAPRRAGLSLQVTAVLPGETSCGVGSITCRPLPRPVLEGVRGHDTSRRRTHRDDLPSRPAQRRAPGRDPHSVLPSSKALWHLELCWLLCFRS